MNRESIPEIRLALLFPGAGTVGNYYEGFDRAVAEFQEECFAKKIAKIEIVAVSGTSAGAVQGAHTVDRINSGRSIREGNNARGFWEMLAADRLPFSGPVVDLFARCSIDRNDAWPNIPDNLMRVLALSSHMLGPGHATGLVADLLHKNIGNFDAIRNGPCKLYVNACTKTGRGQYKNITFSNKDITPHHIAASGALEVFGPHNIDGVDYYDGAYAENPPMKEILKTHFTDLIAVTTFAPEKYHRNLTKEQRALNATTIHDQLDDMLDDETRKYHVHSLNFNQPTHWNRSARLNPDPTFAEILRQQGYKDTKKFLSEILPSLGKESTHLKQDHPERDYTPAKIERPHFDEMHRIMLDWFRLTTLAYRPYVPSKQDRISLSLPEGSGITKSPEISPPSGPV